MKTDSPEVNQSRERDIDLNLRQRSRSRQKRQDKSKRNQEQYLRKFEESQNKYGGRSFEKKLHNLDSPSHEQFIEKDQADDFKSQLLRSFLRIQQQREEPIDKFVKIVWTYKGKFIYDRRLHEIMKEPSKFLDKLNVHELRKMIPSAQGHLRIEKNFQSQFEEFWTNLVQLIRSKLSKYQSKQEQLSNDYEQKISQVISKPIPELIKLEKQINMILKTQSFGSNQEYWKQVQAKIQVKRSENILLQFYEKFENDNVEKIQEENKIAQLIHEEPTSPTLVPYSSINQKLIVREEDEIEKRQKLAQKIFTEQFEKGRQKLQINLSLPHNHGLLTTQIITEQTNTYDQITKEIIQFQKYKRMEEDEEQFNDWVPCETDGRFRDRKPVYLNRARVTRQTNKYGSVHRYTEENPPPKTIQGYKFNIFYPDLYDKQKTPQYYLYNTDDPAYCVIVFKAGPPYKDLCFKILKKQWEFTQKSGFESIFSRGILHLYFNFKKPRFRI